MVTFDEEKWAAVNAAGEILVKFGFPDYSIDFSQVSKEDTFALLEWIKNRVKD